MNRDEDEFWLTEGCGPEPLIVGALGCLGVLALVMAALLLLA